MSLTKEAELVLNTKLGTPIYRIYKPTKYVKSSWRVEKILITEISRKMKWNGKEDLGWAFIANGTRYRLSGLGKTWFWNEEDAENYLKRKVYENNGEK